MILERSPGLVQMKSDRNPVTEVDVAVENEVREFLLSADSTIDFLGEESGRVRRPHSELMWALDPVDGTVNYSHGIPMCGVSLGLIEGDRAVVGVVDLPFLGERYSAVVGCGANRGDERIEVAPVADLRESIVAIGDYAVGAQAESKNKYRHAIARELVAEVQRVRIIGSAATDLVWVADGRLSASVMVTNKPWDTAAGVLIAREAGAIVVDQFGHDHTINSTATIAVAPKIADDILEIVSRAAASL